VLKIFLFLSVFNLMSCKAKSTLNILHYNIKELDSTKLTNDNKQLKKVKEIVSLYEPELLFINEIQYDIDGAPNDNFKTNGENLNKLNSILGTQLKYISFYPANTGKNAKRNSQGEYYSDPNSPGARDFADQVNFGTIPHQYSSGLLSKYPIVEEKVITDIEWKAFNPQIDLTKFTTGDGKALPSDMELFDKNFLDVTLDVKGKMIHVIVLHTVPAYHFGNKKSPNYLRNRDQLRFLEWYLSGKTDIDVTLLGIKPIKGESFIAAGDWNVDPTSDNPGSAVLKRIFDKSNPWISPSEMDFTNEGSGYSPKPFRLMLDYLISSKDLNFDQGKIIHPNFSRTELGCDDKIESKTLDGYQLKAYKDNGKTCSVLIHDSYINMKEASDHYPIYGEISL